jgi:hypothetical protein
LQKGRYSCGTAQSGRDRSRDGRSRQRLTALVDADPARHVQDLLSGVAAAGFEVVGGAELAGDLLPDGLRLSAMIRAAPSRREARRRISVKGA